jgi:hypothetical protein
VFSVRKFLKYISFQKIWKNRSNLSIFLSESSNDLKFFKVDVSKIFMSGLAWITFELLQGQETGAFLLLKSVHCNFMQFYQEIIECPSKNTLEN